MKLIHCADVHLGSPMTTKMPNEKAKQRREEVLDAFRRMVDYAVENSVEAVLLAGDVFDNNQPNKKDKRAFFEILKLYPQLQFYYLRGNHDTEQSYDEALPNLHVFSEEWKYYRQGNVVIAGIEGTAANAGALYATLKLNESDFNVVMLHGDAVLGKTEHSQNGRIELGRLKGKQINYLALGHIHYYHGGVLDERGQYAYAGCLEGRGFDETGEKGFLLLDTDAPEKIKFVCSSKRTVNICEVNATGLQSIEAAIVEAKKRCKSRPQDIVRFEFVGEVEFDHAFLKQTATEALSGLYYYVEVKDRTVQKIDAAQFEKEVSLAGEFLKLVYEDARLSESQKQQIVDVGLKALHGREVE